MTLPLFILGSLKLAYRIERAEQPGAEWIVWIHGAGLDQSCWEPIIDRFRGKFHLLLYDLRGHGESNMPDEPIGWKHFTFDLYELVMHLGINSFHIVAHGFGGLIAVHFGVAYAVQLKTITLLSLPFYCQPRTIEKVVSYRRELMRSGSIRRLAEHIVGNGTLQPADSPHVRRLYEAFDRVRPEMYGFILNEWVSAHREATYLFKYNARPALLISGDKDPVHPPGLCGLVTSILPNSRYVTIFRASSMMFIDQPDKTAEQIMSFMEAYRETDQPPRSTEPFLQELQSDLAEWIRQGRERLGLQPSLKMYVLDGFEVFIDDKEVIDGWNRRYARQILLYLVLNRQVTRNRLCEDLWGDGNLGAARSKLRVCLVHLRKLLGGRFLMQDREHVYLTGEIECDLLPLLQGLEDATREKDKELRKRKAREVLSRLPKQLLSGFCENWILPVREKMEQQIGELAEWKAEMHWREGRPQEAIRYLKLLLSYSADEPEIYDKIAGLYAQMGKRKEADEWRQKRYNIQGDSW